MLQSPLSPEEASHALLLDTAANPLVAKDKDFIGAADTSGFRVFPSSRSLWWRKPLLTQAKGTFFPAKQGSAIEIAFCFDALTTVLSGFAMFFFILLLTVSICSATIVENIIFLAIIPIALFIISLRFHHEYKNMLKLFEQIFQCNRP